MQKRKLILFTILFISLVAVSAVSAAENATTEGSSIESDIPSDGLSTDTENTQLEQSDNEGAIGETGEGTFTALEEKINNATSGSTINLKNDYIYDEGFGNNIIVINKELTINGNGHTIDANHKSHIFKVEGGTVTFKNIIFSNGYYDNNENGGAAIHLESRTCTAENCKFINNTLTEVNECGGAIHVVFGTCTVKNSDFINNSAKGSSGEGGAIFVEYDGQCTAINCNFINNSVLAEYSCGGAVFNVNVEKCTFTNNHAVMNGGAMTRSSAVNCIFTNNSAGDEGGAIYEGSATDCTFKTDSDTCSETAIYTSTKIIFSYSTAVYGKGGKFVITLKDSKGNVLGNKEIIIKFKGVNYNKTTNSKGQVTFTLSKTLQPKDYTSVIKFEGIGNYIGSEKTVKVTIKKATPKIVANAKTFRISDKTKKYVLTFKDNLNKPIKNVWLYIKVNGKTYNGKTNSEGPATFKFTKLTKAGTYKAKITYDGKIDGKKIYYNKVTKTVKITVKK